MPTSGWLCPGRDLSGVLCAGDEQWSIRQCPQHSARGSAVPTDQLLCHFKGGHFQVTINSQHLQYFYPQSVAELLQCCHLSHR